MTAASQAASQPSMEQHIGFRPEQPDDEPFLCRLYAGTRTEEMALTAWAEEQKEAFLRQQFQFQTIHYRRYYSTASFDIILQDERPVGRIYVHRGAGDIRLMDIALLPEYRGAGIGSWILRNLLAEAAPVAKAGHAACRALQSRRAPLPAAGIPGSGAAGHEPVHGMAHGKPKA